MKKIHPDAAETGKAFEVILAALEAFEQSWRDFYPYSSKYDAYLAGRAKLSEQEARGLADFNDPKKSNCAHCHISARGNDGSAPQFTFVTLGLPRNPAIPANADPTFYDLGLCGPLRSDLVDRPEYCGFFRAPSLRNVALRKSFFHNGVMHSLRDAVAFYARTRHKTGGGSEHSQIRRLVPRILEDVNDEPPFGQKPGHPSPLSDAEKIDAIVDFLHTLTDGYRP